jgi:ribosomal-protein-alanine N-acetyltransferase
MSHRANIRYTDRLRLEPIGPKHTADLLRLFQDPAVRKWYGVWTPEMVQREAERIGRAWKTDGVHKWMAYDPHTGELIGRGGLSRAFVDGQDRIEIGWALLGKYHGQGYATEIGRAGLAFAFGELGADEVVSFTETRNTASRSVMERLGFHYVHDFIWPDDGVPCVLYAFERPPEMANKKEAR